jgi:hypothetical protein
MSASFNPSALALAEPFVSARGAKSCALTLDGRKHIVTLGSRSDLLTTPFGASSFQGDDATTRKTIEFRLAQDSSWLAYFEMIDAWAVPYIAIHSERLFKKTLSDEQVLEIYKPIVQRKGTYPATVRCKINVAGGGAVRCWSALDQRMSLPEDLRAYELLPRVHLSHLWIMSRECSFVINTLDLQCVEASAACPFQE